MLFKKKLVDETQMPKPQEYTDTFILTKKLFLVGLRGLQSISNPVERPCTLDLKIEANATLFSQTPRGIWWKNCIIILHQETDVIRTKLRSSILANGHFFFQKIFKQARSNCFTFVKKTFQNFSES